MTFYSDLLDAIDARAESEYTGTLEDCGHLQPYLLSLRRLLQIRANLIRGGSSVSFYTDLLTDIEDRIETEYQGLLVELGDNAPNPLSLPVLLELRDYLNASEGGGGGGGGKLKGYASTYLTTQASQSLVADAQTAITGLSVAYTPTSASNKLLIQVEFSGASEQDALGNDGAVFFGLFKNGTAVGNINTNKYFASGSRASQGNGQDNGGATMVKASYSFEESAGNTSSRTYQATAYNDSGTVLYICRDSTSNMRFASRIAVWEIEP